MKQTFDNLLMLAKLESAPCVDVSDNVIAALSSLRSASNISAAYLWVGIASAAAAACIALAATLNYQSSPDSVTELITYVAWVAQ